MTISELGEKLFANGASSGALGPDLLAPFQARKLSSARVLWVNRRWFASAIGGDVSAPNLTQISQWLIDSFAYVVPRNEDREAAFSLEERTFYADRYGDDGVTPHGGSGRAGELGSFQVKGIGRTPLVGKYADWLHQHGCVWLEEALREAIFSEIVSHEFPLGAVPVIAILDTGLVGEFARSSPDHQRVLVIRPSCIRPAHMQRAPLFAPVAGDFRVAQLTDGRRCQQAVAALVRERQCVEDLFVRAAEQLAYAYVHRIYLGGMLASNWTVTGALVDFGGLSWVPSWDARSFTPGLPPFGQEANAVEQCIDNVVHRVKRVVPSCRSISTLSVIESFRRRLREVAERETRRVLSLEDRLDSSGCLQKVLTGAVTSQCRLPHQLVERSVLDREGLQNLIRTSIQSHADIDPAWISALICRCLTQARRDWPLLPERAKVICQYVGDCWAAAVCKIDGRLRLYLDGEGGGNDATVFGTRMATALFNVADKGGRRTLWRLLGLAEGEVEHLKLPAWDEWFVFNMREMKQVVGAMSSSNDRSCAGA